MSRISKVAVVVKGQAAPIAPYSPAVLSGGKTLYVSGQLGTLADGKLAAGVREQTKVVLGKIVALLAEASMTSDHVVDTTVLLASMDDFAIVNDEYQKVFRQPYPARAAFAVKELPLKALVEIKCVAVKD